MPSIVTAHAESPTSSSRRRRSSPTSTLHSASSNSALVYPVPDSVAWLEQLSLSVTSTSSKTARLRDASFELNVDHARAKVAWVHARSFEEYRQFQHRLQKALRHGHFCHAECPWLYTFVKSYFPKSYILGALLAPRQVLQTRREALERFVKTLQTFVANRNNHCCSVLTSAVADEVLAFVNGDVGKAHQCRLAPKLSSECAALAATGLPASSSVSLPRRSWDSLDTGDSDLAAEERDESEAPPSSAHSADEEDYCPICHSHLGEEAHSPTNGGVTTRSPPLPTPPVSSSSTVSSSVPSPPVSSSDACTDSAKSQSTDSPVHVAPVAPRSHTNAASGNATALPPRAPPRRSSSQPRHHYYTTKLACGHRFHDECIVPKLNESMSCPVCGHAEH